MKSRRSWISRIFCTAICFLGAGLLCGCSLALGELETEEDRLVGVFLTREYLDTGAAELKVDRKGNVSFAEESGRIPGEIRWEEGYPQIVFPGAEGYGIYQVSLWDEGSRNNTEYNFSDDIFGYSKIVVGDEEDSMEVTVYLEPGGQQSVYLNPVYQTPGGEIYLRQGNGMTADMTAGASMSLSVFEERTETGNGEETKKKTEFTVKIVCTEADRPVNILFMGEESNMLRRMSEEQLERMFSAADPKLQVPGDTAYLILERPEAGGRVKREICAEGEEFISFLQAKGDGYLRTVYLQVDWE